GGGAPSAARIHRIDARAGGSSGGPTCDCRAPLISSDHPPSRGIRRAVSPVESTTCHCSACCSPGSPGDGGGVDTRLSCHGDGDGTEGSVRLPGAGAVLGERKGGRLR